MIIQSSSSPSGTQASQSIEVFNNLQYEPSYTNTNTLNPKAIPLKPPV